MASEAPLRLFIIFLLFWGLVFFAASEASLFALGRLKLERLKEEGSLSYPWIEALLRRPRRLIISLLIGNETLNVALSSLTSALFISLWGDRAKWLAIPAVLFGVILFGEVLPKTIGVRNPEKTASWVAYPVARFVKFVGPLHWIVRQVVDGIFWVARVKPENPAPYLTEEDFKEFTETSLEEGALEQAEKDFIHRVFKFSDQTVRKIMTPRGAVFALPLSTRMGEAIRALQENRFSRVPVYRRDRDEIVGVLYAKDLLRGPGQKWMEERGLRPFLRKPYFVPVSKKLDSLFQELQKQRIHLAVVVDEYGKMAGIVTLEDLLEELFGEIYDERDWARNRSRNGAVEGPGISRGA